ncbi:MAG: hypothetical protein JW839_19750 [Candidatus Lokiarchaeota archaeon]|nr:hypothetical protein [Candidatus Lokiarchaeota archaeon]
MGRQKRARYKPAYTSTNRASLFAKDVIMWLDAMITLPGRGDLSPHLGMYQRADPAVLHLALGEACPPRINFYSYIGIIPTNQHDMSKDREMPGRFGARVVARVKRGLASELAHR